jgi:hypothetical protein
MKHTKAAFAIVVILRIPFLLNPLFPFLVIGWPAFTQVVANFPQKTIKQAQFSNHKLRLALGQFREEVFHNR